MAKATRLGGASDAAGPIRVVDRRGGIDVELSDSTSDLFVGGQGTFGLSPRVPNPAAVDPQAAASIGEVQDLIAESSAGFFRSMDPKNPLNPAVVNTTTEGSFLNSTFTMPRLPHEAVYRLVAGGFLRNISGGNVDYTFRVRNTTNSLVLCSAVITLPSDASGTRAWRFAVEGEGQVVLADSVTSAGLLTVGAGTTDALKQAAGQAAVAFGSDPQEWDVTVQMSVANSQASVSCYTAQVLYALAGA